LGVLLDLLFLGIGVLALFYDLVNRWRFWKAFKKPATSWISRGTYLITILFLFDFIYALAGFPVLPLPFILFFGAIAVMVILYPGLVISYSPSMASWNNGFIPILFGLHSLASGLSILLVLSSPFGENGEGILWLQLSLLLFILIGMAVFLSVSYASTSGLRESVGLLMRGRGGVFFLVLGTGVGILFPMILVGFALSVSFWAWIPIACVMRLVGDLGFRYAILKAGIYEAHL
jgi:formate-dependent nitrite reductase membrane component NrfD